MADGDDRKLRNDAWWAPLDETARDEVFRRAAFSRKHWEEIAAWAAATYACKQPSRARFYDFLAAWRPQYTARRIQERVLARDTLRAQLAEVGDMSAEQVAQLEDVGATLIDGGDFEAARALYGIAKGIRDDIRKRLEAGQTQEKLALEREKFREAVKTNVERALDSFLAEVAGDAVAEGLVAQLRSRVLEKVGEARAA